jgi:hypothetical protein
MRKKNPNLVRSIVFLLLFSIVFSSLSSILIPAWGGQDGVSSRIHTFYNQPENTVDVLFIGSSSFLFGISPLTIWQDYGISSYVRASTKQAPIVNYYLLLETLKYQKPKVLVIDGVSLFQLYDYDEKEGHVRKNIDPMKLSMIKINLISEIVSESKTQNILSYIFPMLRYHTRWKEISQNDFDFNKNIQYDHLKGYSFVYESNPINFPVDYMEPNEQISELDSSAVMYFEKIIQVCKENDIEILFLTIPRRSWNYSNFTNIKKFTDKYGLTYIDYALPNNFKTIELDASTDFYEESHLNVLGAQKISKYFGEYLHETYNLTDHREDLRYGQWNDDLKYFTDMKIQKGINN